MRQPVAVNCSECGKGRGVRAKRGARCTCGRFAPEAEDYCIAHDVDIAKLTGRTQCPYCKEERRIEQLEQEMHARRANERMHPTVDAPRY